MLRRAVFGMVSVVALVCLSGGVASAHGPSRGGCGTSHGYGGYGMNVHRHHVHLVPQQVYISQPQYRIKSSCCSHQQGCSPSYGYGTGYGGYGGHSYGGGYGGGLSYSQPGFGFYYSR